MLRAALLTSLLALLAACGPRAPVGPPQEEQPEVVLRGVRMRSYQGSTLAMTGQSERTLYQRSTGNVVATHASLRLRGTGEGNGPPGGMEIRAPRMEGNLGAKQLVASGGVEITTATGIVARTPQAAYDAPAQSARGTEGVQIQGPGYSLQSDTFLLSLPEETFHFEGSVQTVLGAAR